MKTFKQFVKNYALPEACIAECYLGMECVRFFDVHMEQRRNENSQVISTPAVHPLSKGVQVRMDDGLLKIAHRYVLFNTAEIEPYIT